MSSERQGQQQFSSDKEDVTADTVVSQEIADGKTLNEFAFPCHLLHDVPCHVGGGRKEMPDGLESKPGLYVLLWVKSVDPNQVKGQGQIVNLKVL